MGNQNMQTRGELDIGKAKAVPDSRRMVTESLDEGSHITAPASPRNRQSYGNVFLREEKYGGVLPGRERLEES